MSDKPGIFDRLILFQSFRNNEVAGLLSDIYAICADDTEKNTSPSSLIEKHYFAMQRALIGLVGKGDISGNYLQNYLCQLVSGEENTFSHMAENGAFKELDPGMAADEIMTVLDSEAMFILNLAAKDIGIISGAYRFDFAEVTDAGDGRNISGLPAKGPGGNSNLELIHQAMTRDNSVDAAITLAGYYQSYGSGIFGTASVFSAGDEGLMPLTHTDPITMDDLVGCESQKRALIENIEILLAGLAANNVLLYGDSGAGKSSSVKALLNMYAEAGLKLISLAKDKLGLLPDIFDRIAGRGLKFIIFIDDLSFEENEYEFKLFKSIIEGRMAPRPKNAIFIVTTNRKNIVKEIWSDREGQDDVRRRDNMEEKRSLSDRFGITLIYSAPDKQEYLAIVRSIAAKAGLSMPDGELAAEALKWEIRHGGRSGRTARQFVDYMVGIKTIGREALKYEKPI